MSRRTKKKLLGRQKKLKDINPPSNNQQPSTEQTITGDVRISGAVEILKVESTVDQEQSDADKSNAYKEHTKTYEDAAISVARTAIKISGFGLIPTIGLLMITIFQFGLTREQVHLGQRAYLVFQHPQLKQELGVGQFPEIHVELTNSGQTPALDITYGLEVFIGDTPHVPAAPIQIGYLGAGQKSDLVSKKLTPLTQEQFDMISKIEAESDGKVITMHKVKHLFVVGHVVYRDVFGKKGDTTLCAALVKQLDQLKMAACTIGDQISWEK